MRAVDDLGLDVPAGELVALVGPSGCGKTTVLRLIAGFEVPDAGMIQLDGRDVRALAPEQRGVGMVFQHYALFPHLSVAGNVAYGLRFVRGQVDKGGRVEELLELVGLRGYGDRRPDQLSAGQRQRVALARSLAPGPRVLLLDEPLSALDVGLRARLRAEIRHILKAAGATALYVTHDQEEALAVADRVAVMNEGRLEQVDAPPAVYRRPRTPFVARFVGGGNLLSARVTERKESAVRLQLGERAFDVTAAEGSASGNDVYVLVRPERFVVGSDGALRATLAQREYLGGQYRLRAYWAGQTITLLCPDAPALERIAPGDELGLRLPDEPLWLLPREDDRPEGEPA